MLVMSPHMKDLISRRNRRLRDAERGRLAKTRLTSLSKRLATFMMARWRQGHAPTLFTYEGPLTHSLRSALVMQGWAWSDANETARTVVELAINLNGAERPSWEDGQRIWEERFIERTRCVVCTRHLPDERRMYCSNMCNAVEKSRRQLAMHVQERLSVFALKSEHDEA